MIPVAESARPIQILLVEDNPGDVVLTREGLRTCRISNRIHVVGDGEKALAFLGRTGEYRDAPRPDLILMDLNLPRMNGIEVLGVIKSQPGLMGIPVVILSSSSAEEDIDRAYARHANFFITKPLDLAQFIKVMAAIEDFWFSVVKLPGGNP
jgi:two-component system, chemotaxis family, response regulator Rcp1